jgi:hypothetical protein
MIEMGRTDRLTYFDVRAWNGVHRAKSQKVRCHRLRCRARTKKSLGHCGVYPTTRSQTVGRLTANTTDTRWSNSVRMPYDHRVVVHQVISTPAKEGW